MINFASKFLAAAIFCVIFTAAAYSQTAQQFDSAIRSGNSEQQRDALFELKKIANADASAIALPALKSTDEMVRATAATAVIWLPANESVAALLPLLADQSEFVRREASIALGLIGDPSACQPLIELVRKENIIEVKNAAIIALGNIGDASAIGLLVEILNKKPKDEDEFTRRSAARSIGQIAANMNGDRSPVVTPKNFLPLKYKEIEPETKVSQAFTNAVPVLIKILNNKKETIDTQREAAAALGSIADKTALTALNSCSKSSDPYLSEICKEALLRIR